MAKTQLDKTLFPHTIDNSLTDDLTVDSSKLAMVRQMEDANTKRDEFPMYERTTRMSSETIRMVRTRNTAPIEDDFPMFAAALKERRSKPLSALPPPAGGEFSPYSTEHTACKS